MKGQNCTYLEMTVCCDCHVTYSFRVNRENPDMMRTSSSRPDPETVEAHLESEGWKYDEVKAVWVCDECLAPTIDYSKSKFLGYCRKCSCAVYSYQKYYGAPKSPTLCHSGRDCN